jgi:hypothetical protein
MARAPAKPKAPVAPKAAGPKFTIAEADHHIKVFISEDHVGEMRVEAGDYIVQLDDEVVVMPPARFFEAYPELAD